MTASVTGKGRSLRHVDVLKAVLLLVVLCSLALRFVNLKADFPPQMTASGVLYTDEGWYANAATRHARTGHWYLAGDFNPAINMPVGQVLHRGSFALFGTSLFSARITTVVSFILLTVFTGLLVNRQFGKLPSILATLLLASNFAGFAFSRLAIMDLVACGFDVASLVVAGSATQKNRPLSRLAIASLLLGVGILTKPTAIVGAPLLGYFAWQQGTAGKGRFAFLVVSALVGLLLVGGYAAIAMFTFPDDYAYFSGINVGTRLHRSLLSWLAGLPSVLVGIRAIGIELVGLTTILTVSAVLASARYRNNMLIHIFVGWIVTHMAMLSLFVYTPERYYLPLLVPFAGLSAVACTELGGRMLGKKRWGVVAVAPMALVAAVSVCGTWRTIVYLAHARFSFVQMAHGVKTVIEQRDGTISNAVVLGQIADSVAIEIGVHSVNSRYGTRSLDWRIAQYRPKYLLVHTDEEVLRTVHDMGYGTVDLASWDVYENYYGSGQRVRLILVSGKDEHRQGRLAPPELTTGTDGAGVRPPGG